MRGQNIVPVHVLRVITERKNRAVYDLTVADIPEFFANGILVHNSLDASRYALYTDALEGMGDIDFVIL
jgi:hypothetical protein